jgi:hypothetical protein
MKKTSVSIYTIALLLTSCNTIIGCDHITSITGADYDIEINTLPPQPSQRPTYDIDISGAPTVIKIGDISGVSQ